MLRAMDSPPPPASATRWLIPLLVLVAVAAGVAVGRTLFAEDRPAVADAAPSLLDAAPPELQGELAAPFAVELLGGGEFSLEEHLREDGRPVFLNLWASWCIPCRREFPAIDAAAARHPGTYFIGVAVQDDPVAAENFAEEMGVSFPLAIDESGSVENAYPAFGLPVSFIISGDGVILRQLFGEVDEAMIDAELATWFGG